MVPSVTALRAGESSKWEVTVSWEQQPREWIDVFLPNTGLGLSIPGLGFAEGGEVSHRARISHLESRL
jgi:hypothetical protein